MPEINDRESLRDLDGVRLEVEPLPPFVIKQGLSAERLAAEIETQLRRNPLVTFNRARTWTATAAVSIGPAAATAARVRRDVTRQIDQFIEDYKRVNE